MAQKFSTSLDDDLFAEMESARGDVPRSTFIARVLERALAGDVGATFREGGRPRPIDRSRSVGSAASARASDESPVRVSRPRAQGVRDALPSPGLGPLPSGRRFGCPRADCDWPGTNVAGGACPHHGLRAIPRGPR